jgi:branched-chain amino acid transport system permease protein
MVTLAFAQMVYFFSLQAPFTGGEDGIQAVPRGSFSACDQPRPRPMTLLLVVLAIVLHAGSSPSTGSSTRPSARC